MKTYHIFMLVVLVALMMGCGMRPRRAVSLPDYEGEVTTVSTSSSDSSVATTEPVATTAPHATQPVATAAPLQLLPAPIARPVAVTREVGQPYLLTPTMIVTPKNMSAEIRNPHAKFACVSVKAYANGEPVMKLRRNMPQDALFGDANWVGLPCIAVMPPNESGSRNGAPVVNLGVTREGKYRVMLALYEYDGVNRPRRIQAMTSPEMIFPYMHITNPVCPSYKDATEGGCMYIWPI